jgi:hypothetical protein
MSEYVGLALVETDDDTLICETPKWSALAEGTEVFIEAFNEKGKMRGKVLAYADVDKNGEEYAFISKLYTEIYGYNNGSYRRVLSTIRENPLDWEE